MDRSTTCELCILSMTVTESHRLGLFEEVDDLNALVALAYTMGKETGAANTLCESHAADVATCVEGIEVGEAEGEAELFTVPQGVN